MNTSDHHELLRHLSHELRQPLSCIESIAYYFDMALGDAEPELQEQCGRLRRMVQHAHWLLEDAVLFLQSQSVPERVTPDEVLSRLAANLALNEERSLSLRLGLGLQTVSWPQGQAAPFCQHILDFLDGLALAQDPVVVETGCHEGRARLSFSADVDADPAEIEQMLRPSGKQSGLQAFLSACAGEMETSCVDGRMTMSFHFPAM